MSSLRKMETKWTDKEVKINKKLDNYYNILMNPPANFNEYKLREIDKDLLEMKAMRARGEFSHESNTSQKLDMVCGIFDKNKYMFALIARKPNASSSNLAEEDAKQKKKFFLFREFSFEDRVLTVIAHLARRSIGMDYGKKPTVIDSADLLLRQIQRKGNRSPFSDDPKGEIQKQFIGELEAIKDLCSRRAKLEPQSVSKDPAQASVVSKRR